MKLGQLAVKYWDREKRVHVTIEIPTSIIDVIVPTENGEFCVLVSNRNVIISDKDQQTLNVVKYSDVVSGPQGDHPMVISVREEMRQRADELFSNWDFGDQLVDDADGWEWNSSDPLKLVRNVYLTPVFTDSDSVRIRFSVDFREDKPIVEVY